MFEIAKLHIVLILTIGFALASLLGYLTHKINFSPILGYLIGGYLIGPYSPGFVADLAVTEQLAEIGVILMMFGVGLHFKWQDLIKTRNISVPGAVGQTLIASLLAAALIYSIGWSLQVGIIFGVAISVASTVVLIRQLTDNNLLNTKEGHISVGWLIVEDIITVIVLLILPTYAASFKGEGVPIYTILLSVGWVLVKFIALLIILFTLGRKCVSYVFHKVILTKSHELFTLTILAITFVIAIGSTLVFGTSIALGSFMAGIVIGQTDLRKRISNTAAPLKDTFVVIFFLTIGMLFNPYAIAENFLLFIGCLTVILFIKPIAAFLITKGLKYPQRVAMIIAVALAQIGEFSFILAEEAMKFDILPDEGFDVIVACALVSIALNPILFKRTLDANPFYLTKHTQDIQDISEKR